MIEYFLKIWGGAMPHLEKDLGIKQNYYYFRTEKEREEFLDKVSPYTKYGLAISTKEGVMSHLRTILDVVFDYNGRIYAFSYDFGYEYPEDAARYMFEFGEYSCDCNKSLLIKKFCDENFPRFSCGKSGIKLKNLSVRYLE